MTALRFNSFLTMCLTALILLSGQPSISETTISEQILSSDIVVNDTFEPGSGLPVGKIQSMQGEAIVFHRNPTVGYRIQTGLPLYVGDVVNTRGGARVLCRLIDGSRIVIAAETTLKIVQCRINSSRKTGLSFLYLKHGSARFTRTFRTEFSSYDFRVQTDWAFITAREADFVVKSSPVATDIIAFNNSQLEVAGAAQPEDVTYSSGQQRIFISEESISPSVATLSQEDIETFTADFHLAPRYTELADSAGEKEQDNKSEKVPVEETIVETELSE